VTKVVVKKLTWRRDDLTSGFVGVAGMERRYVRIGWSRDEPFEFGGVGYRTLEAAQAAAQDHLEQCVTSALETVP